jgi:methoxymalonate biosynthesis acyl carrier protein
LWPLGAFWMARFWPANCTFKGVTHRPGDIEIKEPLLVMANTDHEQVRARLFAVFSEFLHVEVPSADTDLFESGTLDSQRFVELILHLEQNFQVHIDIQDFEIENFRTIEKIATLILQYNDEGRVAEASHAHRASSD